MLETHSFKVNFDQSKQLEGDLGYFVLNFLMKRKG